VTAGHGARLVTVDGPAGSGKSTLGRRLASALQLAFVDTGLFYRAVTVAAARGGAGPGDTARIVDVARRTRVDIDTSPAATSPRVRIDGAPVDDDELHDPRHAALLSVVSGLAGVRAALLPAQRALGARGAVAVGRDCGTVVFPEAPVKFYLIAASAVRTQRREHQLRSRGAVIDVDVLDAEVAARDHADSSRATGPLRPAPDAHIIDTEATGIEAMVAQALAICAQSGLSPP
jgi:cytidylate kinase